MLDWLEALKEFQLFITTRPSGRPKEILVVDDSPADLSLTLAGFQNEGDQVKITTFGDAEAALAFLSDHAGNLSPDLIVLDLNLPKMSGQELLTALKSDVRLRQIPTVMLSGSANASDIARAYDSQAAAYIIKPASLDAYISAVRAIRDLWLAQAAPPPHPNHGRVSS